MHLFIVMEYCSQTLGSVLNDKQQVFGRQSTQAMNIYEYFTSCEILRELLECVAKPVTTIGSVRELSAMFENITVREDKRNGLQNGKTAEKNYSNGMDLPNNFGNNNTNSNTTNTKSTDKTSSSALLELLDLGSPAKSVETIKSTPISQSTANNVLDLLEELDLNPSQPFDHNPIGIPPLVNNNIANDTQLNSIIDGFINDVKPIEQINNSIESIVAFNKNGLKIDFIFERPADNSSLTIISLLATNSSPHPMDDFLFQAAVPKEIQLQLMPPSSNRIGENNSGAVVQEIRVLNPNKNQLKMRLRLSYQHNGNNVTEESGVRNFPVTTWQ
ncbi:unnamed protein product [Medioppia subpectinata]|uniref:GAE domain-containing protein n=1 Tax=Medioppia subpectinata TaxID=1979941 RepID=A0A7R9KKY3_9ACAR|nr:unnamed protein product [Medioppia subpectinata]CAG2105565.1 unnamed protein product [Medioppia subpectinata]